MPASIISKQHWCTNKAYSMLYRGTNLYKSIILLSPQKKKKYIYMVYIKSIETLKSDHEKS